MEPSTEHSVYYLNAVIQIRCVPSVSTVILLFYSKIDVQFFSGAIFSEKERGENVANRMKPVAVLLIAFIYVLTWGCASRIKVNQCVLYPSAPKIAVIPETAADSFSVISIADENVVYRGKLGVISEWSPSGERVRCADFSELRKEGGFRLECRGAKPSFPFTITVGANRELTKAALKAFYYNRCSFPLRQKYAGMYARNAGHPDSAVIIHSSAASETRPAGTTFASPGGWYDAGDYNKYSVNSAVALYTLMAAYELFPDLFDTLHCSIPESSNSIPDILDEVLYNLRWLLTMQDPEDGGVYHKLTTPDFCGKIMPEYDKAKRYVVRKSTAAALDFAAVCAQASRVFKPFEAQLSGFTDHCLKGAVAAWEWAQDNPGHYYFNGDMKEPAIKTGIQGLVLAALKLFTE